MKKILIAIVFLFAIGTQGLLAERPISKTLFFTANECSISNLGIHSYKKNHDGSKGVMTFSTLFKLSGFGGITGTRSSVNIPYSSSIRKYHAFYDDLIHVATYSYYGERERGGMFGGYETVEFRKTIILNSNKKSISLECSGGQIVVKKRVRDRARELYNNPRVQDTRRKAERAFRQGREKVRDYMRNQ